MTENPKTDRVLPQQSQATKHAFEWPDDPEDSVLSVDGNVSWIQGEHLRNWCVCWCVSWLGATIAVFLAGWTAWLQS